jgi:hypothetical protein
MHCSICETRRPRRYCPGLRSEICSICCGASREVTVACPLECPYLEEARKREKPPEHDPRQYPSPELELSEDFLRGNEPLFGFLSVTLSRIALSSPGAVDSDLREALDALVRTYQTLDSGLIYETRPANLVAAAIQRRAQTELDEFRKRRKEQLGMETLRDSDVRGILVLMQRLEFEHSNGRPRGRAFIDFLRREFAAAPGSGSPGLVVP